MATGTQRQRLVVVALVALGVAVISGIWALSASGSAASPPKVSITTPKNGAVVTEPTVKVAGSFTVAPFDGPSPRVSVTLNGKSISTSVNGAVSYDFTGMATLARGPNTLTVVVNDGNGGTTEASVAVTYKPLRPTKQQCVSDKRGDSRDKIAHMDLVRACAIRRGGSIIFKVTTAKPPPNIHDSFGNPAAPCFEVFRGALLGHGGPAPIQSCGDAQLRGFKQSFWPKVPFGISGKTSTWKVPLKYLPKKSFEWRAYLSNADNYADKAPDKGFLTFVVKGS